MYIPYKISMACLANFMFLKNSQFARVDKIDFK